MNGRSTKRVEATQVVQGEWRRHIGDGCEVDLGSGVDQRGGYVGGSIWVFGMEIDKWCCFSS